MENLCNMIFDIKQKLSDMEYKTLMDQISTTREESKKKLNLFEIHYCLPIMSIDENMSSCLSFSKDKKIIQISTDDYKEIKESIEETGNCIKFFEWARKSHFQIVELDNEQSCYCDSCSDGYEYKPFRYFFDGNILISKIK